MYNHDFEHFKSDTQLIIKDKIIYSCLKLNVSAFYYSVTTILSVCLNQNLDTKACCLYSYCVLKR